MIVTVTTSFGDLAEMRLWPGVIVRVNDSAGSGLASTRIVIETHFSASPDSKEI